MALLATPQNLYEEVKAAECNTKKHVEKIDEMVAEMISGGGYGGGLPAPKGEIYENTAYEFVTNQVPELAFSCPRVNIEGHASTADEQVAFETAALNQFSLDNRMAVFLRRMAVDRCFGYGVAKVLAGESPSPRGYMWPKVERVQPRNFFIDPEATHEDDARWMGELLEMDRDDMQENPAYNGTVIADMPEDESTKESNTRRVPRRRVKYYEIYVKEDRTIYTISAFAPNSEWLREPRRAASHRRGPYVVFGHMIVPDKAHPLAELAAAKPQHDELNLHAAQIAGDAATAKRMMAYDKGDPDVAEKLIKGENGATLGVSGDPRAVLHPIEWGGPQAANLTYTEILKTRLDRILGITETQRGETDPNTTATAENLAASGTSKRASFSRSVFQEQVSQVFGRALWLIRLTDRMRRELVLPPRDDGSRIGAMFVGGKTEPSQLGAEDDSEVKIEPYSMEYMSEGLLQRRAMQTSEIIMAMAPAARQFPEWEWSKILDDQLNALNVQGGGQRYLDKEMLAAFQGLAMGVQTPVEGGSAMGASEEGTITDEEAALLAAASSPY